MRRTRFKVVCFIAIPLIIAAWFALKDRSANGTRDAVDPTLDYRTPLYFGYYGFYLFGHWFRYLAGFYFFACVSIVGWMPMAALHWYRINRPRGTCSRCGYSLTGNTSGTCPECGTAIPKPTNEDSPQPA